MTYRTKALCNWPGCQARIHPLPGEPHRCSKHPILDDYERKQDTRGSARERGYDSAWDKLRRVYIRQHPICEKCGVNPSQDVDHIKPIDVAPELRLTESNLQALCRPCHAIKTKREDPETRKRHGTTRTRRVPADGEDGPPTVDPTF